MSAKARITITLGARVLEELDAIALEYGQDRSVIVAVWVADRVRSMRSGASPEMQRGTGSVLRSISGDAPEQARPVLLSGRPEEEDDRRPDVLASHRDQGTTDPRIEEAVDRAYEAQVARGKKIGNPAGYRASIRADLARNPAKVDALLADEGEPPEPPTSRGWVEGREKS